MARIFNRTCFSFSFFLLLISTGIKAQCPANAEFSYYVQSCSTYQFTDMSTVSNPNYSIVAWEWDFGDGGTSTIPNPTHSFAPGSTYNVSLTVTADSSGTQCTDDLIHQVVVDPLPTVFFTWDPDPTCLGTETYFFGTSSGDIVSWEWDFGDGATSSIQNPIHLYVNAQIFSVSLTVTDVNGCSETISQDVEVAEAPDLDFTINPNPACLNEPTDFSGSSGANIASWEWDFGDGFNATGQNVTHAYDQAGDFSVLLTVTDNNGCSNSLAKTVTVNPLPNANFQHSSPTCLGDSTQFTDFSTTPNGYIDTWVWDFGDGNSSTVNFPDDPNVEHLYDIAGTYLVTLTVTDVDGCIDSISREVEVVENPTANFTYSEACLGEVVQFTDLSSLNGGSEIVNWYWNFDDPVTGVNNTSNLQNPTHVFSGTGTYDVLLFITNQEGCTDSITKPVVVNSPEDVDFTADRDTACIEEIIQFNGIGNNIATWFWEFGDGGTDIGQNPQYAYMQPGTYDVLLTVTDINGCTNSVTHPVNVKPLPMALFDVSSPSCMQDSVYFTDYSTSPNSYIVTWHWYFGDGTESIINYPDNPNVAHLYTNAANYDVSLVITDTYGCVDSTSTEISIIASPIADFSFSNTCYQEMVQFTDESLQNGGGNIVNWFWDFGDPLSGTSNFSTLQNPVHIFSDSGAYFVNLRIQNTTGCFDTIIKEVFISGPPAVDFTIDPDSTCIGSITNFNGIGSNIAVWNWDFGDGGSGSGQNPQYIYNDPGTYDVVLTVDDIQGCTNSVSHEVLVNDQPTALYTYENNCFSDTTFFFDASFASNSVITEWFWEFDDPASGNNTSTLQNPGHLFSQTGSYEVKLLVTDLNGCQDSLTKFVAIYDKPQPAYNFDVVCNPPGTVYFYDESEPGSSGSSIVEWLWEIDNGYFSNEINPHHTYTVTDTCYEVSLTVTDLNQCSATYVDTVCVMDELSVDYTATTVCLTHPTFFQASFQPANDSVMSWKWEFGDGSTPLITPFDTVSYQYQNPGTYQVILTATNTNGCSSSFYKNVTVHPLPVPDFEYESAMCDEPTQFTDLSSGGNVLVNAWEWNFGDISSGNNNFSNQQNPSHVYGPEDSTYFVTLTVTNQNGCIDSITKSVEKDPCIVADFDVLTDPICNGQQACFTDNSAILQTSGSLSAWYWDFGDGNTASYSSYQQNICHTFDGTGFFEVMLVVTGEVGGNSFNDTTYNTVYVNPTPTAEFSNSPACGNTLINFYDESEENGLAIDQWQWDFGNPLLISDTSSLQNPAYQYNQQGTYIVELISINTAGCADTIEHELNVFARPEADFSMDGPCVKNPTYFFDESDTSSSSIVSWQWNFGDGNTSADTSNIQDPVYGFNTIGDYDVTLVITDQNQCSDTLTKPVSIASRPTSAFVPKEGFEDVQGQVMFDNLSQNASYYFWDFDNGDTSYLEEPITQYNEDGTYNIMLIAYNNMNCSDTSFFEFNLFLKGLYIPNAFAPLSPNPDVRLFTPKGYNLKDYTIEVFSTWGELVWTSSRLDSDGRPLESWNGRKDGELLPQGVYVWKVSAIFKDNSIWKGNDIDDGNRKTHGTVTLIH